jgi:hypothetical protein
MNPNVRRIPFDGPARSAFDGPLVDLRHPIEPPVRPLTPTELVLKRQLPDATPVERAAYGVELENAPVVPSAAAPVVLEQSPELLQRIAADTEAARRSPTRYAGFIDLLGGIEGLKQTLSQVPMGGLVRALAENAGMDPAKALMLERGGAILTAGGVGTAGLLAAANALNGDDRPVVVMQTPSR